MYHWQVKTVNFKSKQESLLSTPAFAQLNSAAFKFSLKHQLQPKRSNSPSSVLTQQFSRSLHVTWMYTDGEDGNSVGTSASRRSRMHKCWSISKIQHYSELTTKIWISKSNTKNITWQTKRSTNFYSVATAKTEMSKNIFVAVFGSCRTDSWLDKANTLFPSVRLSRMFLKPPETIPNVVYKCSWQAGACAIQWAHV